MLKVSVVAFESLSDAEKNEASNNGRGKEWSSYIRVELDGQTISLESDAL
jgi:hypothetical protein